MRKLNVAVIGTGFWGVNHARAYKELDCTNLVAICDVNAERAKAVANQYGVKAYTDSAQMLKDPDIEAVSVCTWATILSKEAQKRLKLENMSLSKNRWLTIQIKQKLPYFAFNIYQIMFSLLFFYEF